MLRLSNVIAAARKNTTGDRGRVPERRECAVRRLPALRNALRNVNPAGRRTGNSSRLRLASKGGPGAGRTGKRLAYGWRTCVAQRATGVFNTVYSSAPLRVDVVVAFEKDVQAAANGGDEHFAHGPRGRRCRVPRRSTTVPRARPRPPAVHLVEDPDTARKEAQRLRERAAQKLRYVEGRRRGSAPG